MSRRRMPRKPANTRAPEDGTRLGHLSDAELFAEMGRRLAARGAQTLDDIELGAEEVGQRAKEELQAQAIAALPPEDGSPKPCPKCGKPVPVKTRNRVRYFLTTAGELRLSRNYHYCKACRHGFYPRDAELKLPEEGDVSDAMEKRILDFGVNTSFAEAAQRWSIHYPFDISSNLVRRVVDRVGRRSERAFSPLALQQACRPSPTQPAKALVVAGDGSMLLTREEGWREAKVAVVARAESVIADKSRLSIAEARYVAVLGGQDAFRAALKAALDAELADDVMNIVWLGDGARENWTMAKELCPFATQILDLMHAVQHAVDFGKLVLAEDAGLLLLWGARVRSLLLAPSPDALISELLDCLPSLTDEQLEPLNRLVGYYRSNQKRMRYTEFLASGLPIGSGIVESAHKHVLQVRMKQAGQRWAILKARRMVQLRALYRTAGPRRFHWAVREALTVPPARPHTPLQNAPRRVKRRYAPSRGSRLNRAASI
jgi:hypothetical protein